MNPRLADPELEHVRELRDGWQRSWRAHSEAKTLRQLLLGLETSAVAEALKPSPDAAEAGTLKIEVALPTRTEGLATPLEMLQTLTWASDIIERAMADIVSECRRRGRSWAQIADALGVTRQSAWTKYSTEDD